MEVNGGASCPAQSQRNSTHTHTQPGYQIYREEMVTNWTKGTSDSEMLDTNHPTAMLNMFINVTLNSKFSEIKILKMMKCEN